VFTVQIIGCACRQKGEIGIEVDIRERLAGLTDYRDWSIVLIPIGLYSIGQLFSELI
jgi:hypothetical protein